MRILDKNTAIAIVAGLLLGLGVLAFIVLGGAVCGMSLHSTCGGIVLYSALSIMCLCVFAIATSTGRTVATVVGFNMAIIFSFLVIGYLALIAGAHGDGAGFAIAVDIMIVLPITVLSAWLGTRVGHWRSADSM